MTTIDIIILIIVGAGVGVIIGKALSDCDGLDDSSTGIGFYCYLDCRSVDIHVSGVLADESAGSYFVGMAEPLAGKWVGSTQVPVADKPCDLCDRVCR